MAGLKTVPAVVRDVSEYKTLEMALIENVQREDLNPLEQATAYASLVEDFKLTQEEVAQRVGKDRSSVANYIRLLKLPVEVKEMIQKNQLSMGHARALSSLEKSRDQIELAQRILRQQLNVRQTENLMRNWRNGRKGTFARVVRKPDPNVKAAQGKLQEHFGTKVVISATARGSGKIEIHYRNSDDLIRIYDRILGEE